ncbi:hypothetical protein MTR67_023151 [Solanum verrucosum]|uniref:Uncharacterized protein n=1 Tax=Solanum verrucosum TaxID=315347 RepID=A0AAF0TRK4_SOLVR|nr:hypothetical protein MTR67_023151 [Solanum verrucosum]
MTELKGKKLGGKWGQLEVYLQVLGSNAGMSIQHGINELRLAGGEFTWRKGERHSTAARLDRFMISEDWETKFRNIKQSIDPLGLL